MQAWKAPTAPVAWEETAMTHGNVPVETHNVAQVFSGLSANQQAILDQADGERPPVLASILQGPQSAQLQPEASSR